MEIIIIFLVFFRIPNTSPWLRQPVKAKWSAIFVESGCCVTPVQEFFLQNNDTAP
jgi:hypothetical protein